MERSNLLLEFQLVVEVIDDDHVTFMVVDDWVYTASSMPWLLKCVLNSSNQTQHLLNCSMSPIFLSESQVPSTMRLQREANWATACSDKQERQRFFIASIYPTLSCNCQNGHSQKQLCNSKTHTDHLNMLILTWDSPPKQLLTMALDANSPWSYHVQGTTSTRLENRSDIGQVGNGFELSDLTYRLGQSQCYHSDLN